MSDAEILEKACQISLADYESNLQLLFLELRETYLDFYLTRDCDPLKVGFFSKLFCLLDISYSFSEQNQFSVETYSQKVKEDTCAGSGLFTNDISHAVLLQLFDYLSGSENPSWCKAQFHLANFKLFFDNCIEDENLPIVNQLVDYLDDEVYLRANIEGVYIYKRGKIELIESIRMIYFPLENKVKVFFRTSNKTVKLSKLKFFN